MYPKRGEVTDHHIQSRVAVVRELHRILYLNVGKTAGALPLISHLCMAFLPLSGSQGVVSPIMGRLGCPILGPFSVSRLEGEVANLERPDLCGHRDDPARTCTSGSRSVTLGTMINARPMSRV